MTPSYLSEDYFNKMMTIYDNLTPEDFEFVMSEEDVIALEESILREKEDE